MTTAVVSVSPETPAREIAHILLEKGISAVPVIDATGAPIGMVSEGDLIGRSDADREARRDWWLELLAEGENLSPEFLGQLRAQNRIARDVMATPIVSIGEEAEVSEIARLLATHRIKRVPVVRDGHIVGIVSRADLLRGLAASRPAAGAATASTGAGFFAWIDRQYRNHRHAEPAPGPAGVRAVPDEPRTPADDFRALVRDHERGEAQHREEERRAAVLRRQHEVKELIDHHVGDAMWRGMLHNARLAAERGQTESMLLRFPSQLCSDHGRAINTDEPNWPATLRGEAAELYLRWEHDLKPNGFHLAARILDYPGGMPGDVGLFLVWGE
ncbi:MAG TPA: CBS domain-containing protein [Stellaceae bacterium]|nr:CBS domain-containing protein [Stellaceae bacterium]